MITRQQYMNNEYTFNEYYSQFATTQVKNVILSQIGIDRLLKSEDEHLNDIPLKEWDMMENWIRHTVGRSIAEANGGGVSLSDCVCVAKAAARELIKEYS